MSLVSLILGDYSVLREVSTWEGSRYSWGGRHGGSPFFLKRLHVEAA